MTEFLQRDFAHQNFFDLCIHEKQRLRQALNPLSNLLLTKILLCWDRPNITGKYNCSNLTNAPGSNLTTEGSLFNEQGSAPENATGEYRGTNSICLDASRSSTIFGQSMTVQPASLLLMPCIKI